MIITKSEPFTKEETERLKKQLSSLALDLKRVALGYNRGSTGMAERFLTEALCRKKEIDLSVVKPYIAKLLKQVSNLQSEKIIPTRLKMRFFTAFYFRTHPYSLKFKAV